MRWSSSTSSTSRSRRSSRTKTSIDRDDFVHDHLGTNSSGELGVGMEEIDAVIGSAKHVVEHTIHQQAYAAVPMETRGVVADYVPSTDEMTIYAASQSPHEARAFVARSARHAAAPNPSDHEGHGRRLRPEDLHAAGGVGRRPRCSQARRAAEVDRRPAGEPRRWREVAGRRRLDPPCVRRHWAHPRRRPGSRIGFGRISEALSDVDRVPDRTDVPWSVPSPCRGFHLPHRVLEHRTAHPIPRTVAVRDVGA